jgi:ATP-dependent DNA ligase
MILQILNELAATSSRLEKEAIIKREVNNELLKRVFFLAYDPFTQFYIRKIPKYDTKLKIDFITLDEIINGASGLIHLSSRTFTGNAGINHLQFLLSMSSADDAKVIERIIGKDLKCGASDSTANKIWPGLVHDYPCMLASAYDEKLVAKIKWPALAQLKMDGMRFNAIVKDGKCEFRSRNGKEIQLLGHLEKEFIKLANKQDFVFDGELVVFEDGKILDRQTGNGILNKAVKGTITSVDAEKVHATLWDCIPYNVFSGEKTCDIPYSLRFGVLGAAVASNKIHIVESKEVANIDEAQEIFKGYLADGQEGIILKDMNAVWENKRARHLIKFKGELECDLKIVGIQEGTGKYVGKVGAYICESEDGIVKCDVGSGFKDNQRDIDDTVIGKIVAVKYNARIKNKQGVESLFLPIFLEIREDKIIADLSKNIA